MACGRPKMGGERWEMEGGSPTCHFYISPPLPISGIKFGNYSLLGYYHPKNLHIFGEKVTQTISGIKCGNYPIPEFDSMNYPKKLDIFFSGIKFFGIFSERSGLSEKFWDMAQVYILYLLLNYP